jgi:GMP synthase-like glutamine amidotransferase
LLYVLRQWKEGQIAGIVHHARRQQLPYEIVEAFDVQHWPELKPGDALIGLGGPPSVCNMRQPDYEHTFLLEEELFLAEARRNGIPLLGLCLSHQLLACMEGQPVGTGRQVFGIEPVELTRAGQRHWLFEGMPSRFYMYQNHSDYVLSIASTARLLGCSATCTAEAVAWDDRTVSTQFHPEVLLGQMPMCMARCRQSLAATGLTMEQMLARVPADYESYTERMFDNFFYRAGLITRPDWQPAIYAVAA